MNQVKWRGKAGFEDLMRDLNAIEESLMTEHSGLSMDLMVIEARLREHFQYMEQRLWTNLTLTDLTEPKAQDLSYDEIQAMIPKDLSDFSAMTPVTTGTTENKSAKTIAFAAVLAFLTACGVFALASFVQLLIS